MGRTQNPPHFLVISPPKTGSTWLAENLRCHPDLFLPECKELKYFSSLHRFVGPDWYRAQFARALGRLAGEASPSYAALPSCQIERIHREYPHVRLLFLMRDPISRAWSHARHAHRFQEGRFDGVQTGAPSDADWVACCESDWLMASGDYLGQLKRWLAVFPREQFLIGFYESIAKEPERLLRTAFRFVGTDDGVDLSTFPTRERVFPGPERGLPPSVEASLRVLWHARTLELVEFLRTRL
ncbi:MAG TPA: sulfotransferase domain-containing protein, partial [Gemmata sp.]|nr:sulfotransferase domain-containing protein [Gemmata sp.]